MLHHINIFLVNITLILHWKMTVKLTHNELYIGKILGKIATGKMKILEHHSPAAPINYR